MFHDDQHGTACVGSKPEEMKIVMNEAGFVGIAVCSLLMEYGYKNFIFCDTKGGIYK